MLLLAVAVLEQLQARRCASRSAADHLQRRLLT
jgi:hypothetical protein